ncbi:putative PKS-NRPS protein [Trichocladium antarcticum]|uniref:PKS-NRPS protein n=1 Tax=Trichocladium antarcticum TaxID=1450529 RepID=A0AAN6ZA83_9PEZI|nr:putative PKS-NRPS protein [Trichocladium antarcticum]
MSREPIAVIGSGCRFPGGADTPSKLWDLLRSPPDLKQEIPKDRFDVDRFYHPDNAHHGTANVRHSYFLDGDFKAFDAAFFGIKAAEALAMDPQQRLLLETVYESLESAGMPMEQLRGSQTGVFVGNMSVDFTEILVQDIDTFPTYFAPGTARSILSNRISYFFDWHGPSITIDTACSSSLIAVHQAVQSIRAGEVPLAIAAGANLLLGPSQYVAESKLKMLSPGGLSRMWDEAADGYARGDGFASVVLKPLRDAIRDGDRIECVIRETGSNQDGKTQGITMPSPTAQATLIRDTYRRAGLDLSRPADRPQYFEAHGTGTPAGDPVESEAISTAFYGPDTRFKRQAGGDKLLVGSVKTVIGHTEGTAGLASLLKVSLALQRGKVPPNLHFNRLSPGVKPHYQNLQIPTTLLDWPDLPEGAVRRASVNSFGFGGANAHAILEAYTPQTAVALLASPSSFTFAPLLISGASDTALAANIAAQAEFLEAVPDAGLKDISYTLHSHRSALPKRAVFAAASRDALVAELRAHNTDDQRKPEQTVARSLASRPRTLGVFTGQGAQWPRMGAELIERSAAVAQVIDALEQSLATLPGDDRPSWSLREQMLAPAGESQIDKAELSQPLCTALQIVLVDVLGEAGITFDAVVGHSSGEIGAAYAAGVITAADAIRIAYYRGLHTRRCGGPSGQPGAMMAVGTSFGDASELCALDDFQGRLAVAASNSSSSVTLSGDADAIQEAALVFEEERKFHRALRVDKAYHSHHMVPCLGPYTESLRACNIAPRPPSDAGCVWISSVHGVDIADVEDDLGSVYWAKNMGQTVLFSQALESALRDRGPFDQVLELGPHPALKGPATQVIDETTRGKIPYLGTILRNRDATEALAHGLGGLWAANGRAAVDLVQYEAFLSGQPGQSLADELPRYRWDHQTPHYHDSRVLRALRTASTKPNELLGTRIMDNSPSEARWRNRLSAREVPWLKNHQVQNQAVFPGAGYIAAGFEAVRQLFHGEPISVVKMQNFVVGQALIIPEVGGMETLVSLTNIVRGRDSITARFAFFAEEGRSDSVSMAEKASGSLVISLGEADPGALPPRPEPDFQMLDVPEDRFYDAVGGLGFGYSGPFRALTELTRKMDCASGCIVQPEATDGFDRLLVHPAALDAAVQSIILAYCFPGDTRLRTTHLPTRIDSIQINFPLCEATRASKTPFRSSVPSGGGVELSDINGDVDVYTEDGTALIQLQGLHTKPLVPPTPETDLPLFTEWVWGPLTPHGRDLTLQGTEAGMERALFNDLERVAYFYVRQLDLAVPRHERKDLLLHQARLFDYVDHVLGRVEDGTLPHAQPGWKHDTHAQILEVIARQPESIDLELMHAVGENLASVIRGEMNMLEPMVQDNKLNRFYIDALGMSRYLEELSRMAAQISHRYPHMHVLEVGAGTGGATKILLQHLAGGFEAYAYTDISSGFFPTARDVFDVYANKMAFKTLDIEKDIEEQGYQEHAFDLVIANLVVHATKNLEATLRNLRRLVKPGGYLLLLEITDNDPLRFGFIFGGLPGWWLGEEDGRRLSPCVEVATWDRALRNTGFSGADEVTARDPNNPLSVILTQAVDDRVALLRQPLTASPAEMQFDSLTIIGAAAGRAADLARGAETLLSPYFKKTHVVTSLVGLGPQDLPLMGTVLSLAELDSPVFKGITAERLRGFQQVFQQSKNILWVTTGYKADDPYSAMVYGVGRNFLDFETLASADAGLLAECVLRFEFSDVWDQGSDIRELLWTTEPDLAYEQGRLRMPRIMASKERNARYNSSRRAVTRDVNPATSPLSLRLDDNGSYALFSSPHRVAAETRHDTVKIRVTKSVLRAAKLSSSDYLFVVAGTDEDGKSLIAVSDSQSSVVEVDRAWTMPVSGSGESVEQAMLALYNGLLAQGLLHGLEHGRALVVLDASPSLARALKGAGSRRGVTVTSLASLREASNVPGTIFVHPRESARSLKTKLPAHVDRFADFSDCRELKQAVVSSLPAHCDIQSWQTLTRPNALVTDRTFLGLADVEVPSILRAAWAHGKVDQKAVDVSSVLRARPGSLSQVPGAADRVCLVDWSSDMVLPARIQPLVTTTSFSPDKTYWLVGLTGGLGQSLCRWMVEHGARYIAMTSRNPKLDARWLSGVESLGAVIKAFPNDITSRDAVQAAHRTIMATMPPIGGVAHGAMVLHDAMFAEVTMDKMNKVLKPKVEGAIHLDEIFYDTPLDWFVYLSSVVVITGNKGQGIYAAANMFINSMTLQRRKRGVPAAAVNIGAILGNGYVTRELNQQQQVFLQEVGNNWLSEQDFLTIFAEGVAASKLDSTEAVEITTGLRLLSSRDEDVTWATNPKFQYLVQPHVASAAAAGRLAKSSNVPLKKQLEEAKTADEVSSILEDAYANKLRSILQIAPDRDVLSSGLDDIGMDSLVAVEIRSWVLKELSAEVTVLEVLNSGTAGALLQIVKERALASLALSRDNKVTEPPAAPEKLPSPRTPQPGPVVETAETMSDNLQDTSSTGKISSDAGSSRDATIEQDSASTSTAPSSPIATPIRTGSEKGSESPHLDASVQSSFPKDLVARSVPISFGQSRFWFLKHFLPDQSAFNITTVVRMHGTLNVERLASAVTAVGNHHEALRTAFVNGTQPMQVVLKTTPLELEHKRIKDAAEATEAYEAIQRHVYNLEAGQTMRIQVLSLSSTMHFLILGYPHINMDGLSFEVFFNDIQKAYQGTRFTPGVMQYPDFSIREHAEYRLGKWKPELDFWRKEFAQVPAPLPVLPLSHRSSRPAIMEYGTTRVERRIPAELSAVIKTTARKFKAGAFAFYLAVLKALIVRHVDVDQLCIGLADANRRHAEVLESIGLYLNLVPLRVACDRAQPFSNALEEMHSKYQLAFANSRVPFDIILNELGVARSASHPPLFQVFMNYRQGISEVREFCDCECEGELVSGGQLAYDIAFDVVENPGGETNVMLSVQKALYDESSATLLLDSFFSLLEAFANNPASRINKPTLYSQLAVEQALELGTGPSFEHAWPPTLPHRIDDVIRAYPDKLAITDGYGSDLSYFDVGARVDSIVAALDEAGASGIVGVLQNPTPASACSVLGILKAGLTYVPLDPRVGSARLEAIIAESKPSCILVDDLTEAEFPLKDTPLINVTGLSQQLGSSRSAAAEPAGLAALLYTSGSTGTPKGICLSHANLRSNVEIGARQFGFREGAEVVLQQTAYSFDMSLTQILYALSTAGVLVVASQNVRGDPVALADLMRKTGVTMTMATPAEYISMIRHGLAQLKQNDKWRLAASGGEKLSELVVANFRSLEKNDLVLCNGYGPAEATFFCNLAVVPYHRAEEHAAAVALKTCPNNAIYILGDDMKPVPAGVPGEVCIGGAGVGLGYLNNAELTSQKFPANRYANARFASQGWNAMHLTGDRGRLTPDGELILEGRASGDGQVKVRGIRIELEEAELSIVTDSQGAVLEAAVSVRTDASSGTDYLVAHVVLQDRSAKEAEQMAYLQDLHSRLRIPQYMRPSAIVPVASLPLTVSKKLDRRAVKDLPVAGSWQAPSSATSGNEQIKRLWEQVIPGQLLAGREISPTTDFFHVGGTSLLLVELQALLKKKLGAAPSVQQLFQASTLETMAALADGTAEKITDGHVDWEAEAGLLPDSSYEAQDQPGPVANPPKVVVLTGSTGFVGRHILERLLRESHIEKVYCIAVRKRQADLPGMFTTDPRVEILAGNLGTPDLGLSVADAHRVFSAADVVIHNGADVSFMKTYSSLRRTNVEAVKQLARLAQRRRIPFHFVSSASVTQLTPLDEISMAAYPPGTSASVDGYVAAKWVSEHHLELVAGAKGLPVTIHRPSSISGNDASDLDLMGNLFRFVERLEAVPESKEWKGYFDLISVHSVAAAIVKTVVGGHGQGGGVRYQYEAGEMVYPLSTMSDMSDMSDMSAEGFSVKTLPLEEWIEKAEAAGLSPLLAAYLKSAAASNVRWAFPKLVSSQ